MKAYLVICDNKKTQETKKLQPENCVSLRRKILSQTIAQFSMNTHMTSSPSKILVTGSAGHLGEGLVRVCRQKGYEVIGIDILPSAYTDHVGSITDREFVKQHMQGVDTVLHAATLHKPHVATHSKQDFIDVNISGTLCLLEESVAAGVQGFIFTSTTSTFGAAMVPGSGQQAIWVTEQLVPISKNIYGLTKLAAEDLCQLFYRLYKLPCLVLRTSRFFLELDDNKQYRESHMDPNIKANEFLYRRVDIRDVVDAHLLAMEKAEDIGFGRYIISATTPFRQEDLAELQHNPAAVVGRMYPEFEHVYETLGWTMFSQIGRVYVNDLAREELCWEPKIDFQHILNKLQEGNAFFSELALSIGIKGYHEQTFDDGPYPVS